MTFRLTQLEARCPPEPTSDNERAPTTGKNPPWKRNERKKRRRNSSEARKEKQEAATAAIEILFVNEDSDEDSEMGRTIVEFDVSEVEPSGVDSLECGLQVTLETM